MIHGVIFDLDGMLTDTSVDGIPIDMAKTAPIHFRLELGMKNGFLKRKFTININGNSSHAETERFCSMERKNMGVISYRITAEKVCSISSGLCGDVRNQDANYDEFFWQNTQNGLYDLRIAWLLQETRKTIFGEYALCRHQWNIGQRIYRPRHGFTGSCQKPLTTLLSAIAQSH